MKLSVGLLVVLWVGATVALKARYDNYKVFSVDVKTEEQLDILNQLADSSNGFDFWSDLSLKHPADIMVAPHLMNQFGELMESMNLDFSVKVENVQKLIDDEQPKVMPRATFGWDAFYTLEQIYAWVDEQVARYPFLTQEVIGTTFEGRQMRAVKLSKGAGNPAIFIESNIHAREWITSASATYFLNELLTSTSLEMQNLANTVDWYFIIVANPDGFSFCHTDQRLWRKTRSTTSNALCRGADPNRNFGFNWMTGGASNNPCSDTYAGPSAFSEVETRNIRDYFNRVKGNVKMYIAFHSYGQYVLLPWGHTTAPSAHHAALMQIGNAAKAGFAELAGTQYTVGSIASVLYVASGGSADWATGVGGIPVSFTFEFRDLGANGFVLPANQIVPNSREVVAAMIRTVAMGRELGYM